MGGAFLTSTDIEGCNVFSLVTAVLIPVAVARSNSEAPYALPMSALYGRGGFVSQELVVRLLVDWAVYGGIASLFSVFSEIILILRGNLGFKPSWWPTIAFPHAVGTITG